MLPIEITKTLFVGLLVGMAHFISGICVLIEPAALGVTPLAGLHHLADLIGYGSGFSAALLMGVGLMAILASMLWLAVPRRTHALLFVPQEILLVFQLWTISVALVTGQYPDGYIPTGGGFFVLSDQIWAFILATSHSVWLAVFISGGSWGGRRS